MYDENSGNQKISIIISVGKYEATIIFPFFYILEENVRQIVNLTRMTENLKKAGCLFSLYRRDEYAE